MEHFDAMLCDCKSALLCVMSGCSLLITGAVYLILG